MRTSRCGRVPRPHLCGRAKFPANFCAKFRANFHANLESLRLSSFVLKFVLTFVLTWNLCDFSSFVLKFWFTLPTVSHRGGGESNTIVPDTQSEKNEGVGVYSRPPSVQCEERRREVGDLRYSDPLKELELCGVFPSNPLRGSLSATIQGIQILSA